MRESVIQLLQGYTQIQAGLTISKIYTRITNDGRLILFAGWRFAEEVDPSFLYCFVELGRIGFGEPPTNP